MRFEYTQHYAGPPAEVVAMLGEPGFVAELAGRVDALEHSVETSGNEVSISLRAAAPKVAAMLLGEVVTMRQRFRFETPATDGSIAGTLEVEVPGTPVEAVADLAFGPDGAGGTTAVFTGDLTVRVPLFAAQVEKKAEPFIAQGLAAFEQAAATWKR